MERQPLGEPRLHPLADSRYAGDAASSVSPSQLSDPCPGRAMLLVAVDARASWVGVLGVVALLAAACGASDDADGAPRDVAAADVPDAPDAPDAPAADVDGLEELGGDDAAEADLPPDTSDASEQDPTDPVAAQQTLRRVFSNMELDPTDPLDLRRVWTEGAMYEAYLEAWAADQGVTLPIAPTNKAECAFLTTFDPTVPYCGPGCGNSTTLAPPCLNEGCFAHDVCYGALECRQGQLIDASLSFGEVTACCDAPLAPARATCIDTVAADFFAGRLSLSEVALFNAVAALMVAMETSPLLDGPPDRPAGQCDETFENACGPGELTLRAAPSEVEAGLEVEVCGTLLRGGRPVGQWSLETQAPATGTWTLPSAQGEGEAEACVRWQAPSVVEGSTTATLDLTATVLDEAVAAESVPVVVAEVEQVEAVRTWAGTVIGERANTDGIGGIREELDLRVTTNQVGRAWNYTVEIDRFVFDESLGEITGVCPAFGAEQVRTGSVVREVNSPGSTTTALLGEPLMFSYSVDIATTLRFPDNDAAGCPIRTSTRTESNGRIAELVLTTDGQLLVRLQFSGGFVDAGSLTLVGE